MCVFKYHIDVKNMFTYHMLIKKKHNTHKDKSKTNKQTTTNRTVKTTLNNERITGAVTASYFKVVTQMLQKYSKEGEQQTGSPGSPATAGSSCTVLSEQLMWPSWPHSTSPQGHTGRVLCCPVGGVSTLGSNSPLLRMTGELRVIRLS